MDSNTIADHSGAVDRRAPARNLAAAESLVASHGRRMMTTALGVWEDESSFLVAADHLAATASPTKLSSVVDPHRARLDDIYAEHGLCPR